MASATLARTPTLAITDTLTASATLTVTPAATATPSATPTLSELEVITAVNGAQVSLLAEIRFAAWELATAVAWAPDGEILAAAVGNTVYLYNGKPGLNREWLPRAALRLGALTPGLAFSPDSAWLAAGSRDGLLRVWRLADVLAGDDRPAWQVQAHKKGVNSVRFSPDGERLASGGNDAVARSWALADGVLLETTVGGTYAVPCIAYAPDGAVLAVVNGPMIRLRQVGTARIMGSFRSEAQLFSAAFSPDGQLLAVGDNDNHVLVWEIAQAYRTGQETYPEPLVFNGHAGRPGNFGALIWQVAFSPDGGVLATAGGDGVVWLWDVNAKAGITALNEHTAGVSGVTFSPDGKLLASVSLDQSLRIWGVQR